MPDIILILGIAAVLAWAVRRTVLKTKKGGCCGTHETVTLNRVQDRNKSHYPYQLTLDIGGMTCENCARRVSNALNAMDGVWAVVRFETGKAEIRCKQPPDEKAIRQAVINAGYVVMDTGA